MPVQDDVYTISDEDVLRSLQDAAQRRRRPAATRVDPDDRPSSSVRGHVTGGGRPLVSSTLSLFVCGAGQAYNGQGKLGLLLFLTELFAISAHWALAGLWSDVRELASLFGWTEWQLVRGLAIVDFMLIFLVLFGVHQAYRRAEADHGEFDGLANPVLSGLASMMLPGWGQLINAQAGKAMVFLFSLLAGLFTAGLMLLTPFPRLLAEAGASDSIASHAEPALAAVLGTAGIMWVLGVYDAVLVAGYRRRMS
ncbi:MAG TPA: hypothetical protein VJV23_05590 [Candidatus Polarisedimenticolia bacterium]|nr:hypothetical protein [Candidatus Polarisedimenticolia bacterium]